MAIFCKQFRTLSRRDFVRIGGAGLLGLTATDLFRAQARAAHVGAPEGKAKRMMVIWLGGGPPHMDMFDPKPESPVEFRGDLKVIKTRLPGVQFSEALPKLAAMADRFTVIRSCSIGNETWGHGGGAYWMTGNPRRISPAVPKYPMYGSAVKKIFPESPGLPNFVAFGKIGNHSYGLNDPSYLGPAYQPFVFDPTKPGSEVRSMLTLPDQMKLSRFEREANLVRALDGQLRQQDALEPMIGGLDKFQQKAFDLLRSPKLRAALDVESEGAKTIERYGANLRGSSSRGDCKKILVGRRLLEAGVPFVYVPFSYWDFHGGSIKDTRAKVPSLDMAVAALLEDLDDRGMLDSTLVVMLGEMGRSPKLEGKKAGEGYGGRGHWGTSQFVFTAGGGIKRGAIVGKTDKTAAYVTDSYYKVESFGSTVYHLLGIDPQTQLHTYTDNRPLKLIAEDAPLIKEALA